MNEPNPQHAIRCQMLHPVLSVKDVAATVDFYVNKLGFSLGFLWEDPPTLAGLNLDRISLHVSKGEPAPAGCSIYFAVEDVDAMYKMYVANGVDIVFPPEDQEYGLRDFAVKDLNGYQLTFGCHLPPKGAPLKIERSPLNTRIESRLLAVVEEIAASKDMSVGEMLEETLLHTFEPTPDGGVASPHTAATLRLIEELKKKHGIDYETHDSYRFTE